MKGDRYTIDARPASPQTAAMMRGPMLQALLEDRFQLKVRRDIRDVPVYALAAGKGPLKMEASKTGGCTPMEQFDPTAPPKPDQPPPCGAFGLDKNGGMATHGQTMAGLCRQLSAALNRDVVDRTGLTGTFDIHLELTNDELFPFARQDGEPDGNSAAAPSDPVGAVMAAMRKLGLQLVAAKSQGEFLVIEHIDRPTEN